MSDVDLRVLLAGYLDGELSDEERARVESALAADPMLRAELEEMRRLQDAIGAATADARGDVEVERFWGGVYNRLERQASWMLLLFGLLGLFGAGFYLFVTNPSLGWWVKGPAIVAGLGALGLLWSVWRERRRLLPYDRYAREVHR